MKKAIFTLLFAFLFFQGFATSIGIGYASAKVVIWRFWEIGAGNVPVAKMLVYNICDSPVSFLLIKSTPEIGFAARRGKKEWAMRDSITLAQQRARTGIINDTIVRSTMIPARGYEVFNVIEPGNSPFYDDVFIDNKRIGIMPDLKKLSIEKYGHRYYSYEGLNGLNICLVGKDNLLTEPGKKDKMTLYLDYTYKPYREKSRQMSMEVNEGVKGMTIACPDGRVFSLDRRNTKVGFRMEIENKNNIDLDVTYTLARNKVLPVVEMEESIPEREFSRGMKLPVLVSR